MLKEIREYCGIRQADFAVYLKMSRSHLSMAESNRRDYPTDILLALVPLHIAITGPAPAQKQTDDKLNLEVAAQEKDLSEWIRRRKTVSAYKLQTLEINLAAMKESQARSAQVLEVLGSIKAAAKPEHLDIYNFIEQTVRTTQKKTGKDSQWKLELQIYSLQAELEYLNNSGQ